MKVLRGIDDIAIHEFNERDVVRHRLVQKIVVAYDKYERENRAREEEKREEKALKAKAKVSQMK
jgi:phosphate starvation-inducible PhoH-like protein